MSGVKYLVHFRPGRRLTDLISQQPSLVLPQSGLHSSLCFFYMDPKREAEYMRQLSQVKFRRFAVETQQVKLFDNASLVLTLSKPRQLQILHEEIAHKSRWYSCDAAQWTNSRDNYYFENYSPHITISKEGSKADLDGRLAYLKLMYVPFIVREIALSRKTESWEEILRVKCSGFKQAFSFLRAKYLTELSDRIWNG